MSAFILIALGLSLGYALFERAGVTADWNWTLCVVGCVSALFYGNRLRRRRRALTLSTPTLVVLGSLLALAALAIVPLPTSLIATLSPSRYQLLQDASPILGVLPSYATLSLVPLASLQYLLTLGAVILTFVLLHDVSIQLREASWGWSPVWPLLALAAAQAALGIYQAYAEGGDGYAHGTFANRDHFAGFLELVLPIALFYAFAILGRERQRYESPAAPAISACLLFGIAGLLLVAIVHSLSRMAFLATLAALSFAALVALYLRTSSHEPLVKVTPWRRWLPAGLIALVAALGFVFLPTDSLIARFADLAMTEDISADTRAQIWSDSVGIVKAFPLVGVGLGGYESALYRFKTVAPMYTVDYAHNDYLQVLVEMGVAGFALGLVLLLMVLWSAFRGAFYARDNDHRLLQIGVLGGLTAIALHSFVDFNMYVPANALVVAWISGIASAHLTRPPKRQLEPA